MYCREFTLEQKKLMMKKKVVAAIKAQSKGAVGEDDLVRIV